MTAALLDRPTTRPAHATAPGAANAPVATLAATVHVRRPAPARPGPLPTAPTAPTATTAARRDGATGPTHVRLTRRGRAVRTLLVLAVGLLVVTAALVRGGAPAIGSDGAVPAQPQIVVQQGESLWSIAKRVSPGADPRSTVLQLKELNGLTRSDVTAGQPLLIPIAR